MNLIIAGILALALALGVAAWAVNGRADARAQWAQAVMTATANAKEVEAMAQRVKACIGEQTASRELEAQIEAERAARVSANARAAQAERTLRDALYRDDPECADWGSTPVCPAILDRIRADMERVQ